MGLIQSTLRRKRQKTIDELDTLNNSLESLKHFEKKCNQDIENKRRVKKKIENEIKKCTTEYSKYSSLDCKICFDNLIEVILLPCGHCYCHNCSNNMTKCYICQQEIKSKHKIYKN